MKYNMKSFPEVPVCKNEKDRAKLVVRMITWRFGFEKELQEKLAYHEKMIEFWESEKAKTHPLGRYREDIASEWRVSRGTINEILGE